MRFLSKHLWEALVLADSDALVEALNLCLLDSDALVDALYDADAFCGFAGTIEALCDALVGSTCDALVPADSDALLKHL